MDINKAITTDQYMRIPKAFRSSETGKMFTHCMVCNKYLLEEGTPYMIEKAMKQHPEVNLKEVIFEYAICFDCSMTMSEAVSEESRNRINDYFSTHVDFQGRLKMLLERKTRRVDPWINKCLVKGVSISQSPEYQLVGQCDGKHLLFMHMPFALSLEAMSEMHALLSAQTLGEIDDFMGNYFSGPPEIAELLRKRPVLLV